VEKKAAEDEGMVAKDDKGFFSRGRTGALERQIKNQRTQTIKEKIG